jgi:hypothetical protein
MSMNMSDSSGGPEALPSHVQAVVEKHDPAHYKKAFVTKVGD